MGRIGMTELLIVLAIILLLFGARKLPEIGNAIGKAIREFRKSIQDHGGHQDSSHDDKI